MIYIRKTQRLRKRSQCPMLVVDVVIYMYINMQYITFYYIHIKKYKKISNTTTSSLARSLIHRRHHMTGRSSEWLLRENLREYVLGRVVVVVAVAVIVVAELKCDKYFLGDDLIFVGMITDDRSLVNEDRGVAVDVLGGDVCRSRVFGGGILRRVFVGGKKT